MPRFEPELADFYQWFMLLNNLIRTNFGADLIWRWRKMVFLAWISFGGAEIFVIKNVSKMS